MDTEKRFGLKKPTAIMLFVQMIVIIVATISAIYLMIFIISNKLGGWMITSSIFILLSMLMMIFYSVYGYKKGELFYKLAILPFLGAVFVNVLLPGRNSMQIALLTLLFALMFSFLLNQKDDKLKENILTLMVLLSLAFSIYSAINADVSFLGDVSKNWPTYVAMYLSIFTPVICNFTYALIFYVKKQK